MSVTKQRYLVSNKDNGILPAGIKAHSCPTGNCIKGKGVTYPAEALPDMFVFYKNTDGISVDPSATPTVANLILGQYKANKFGVIDRIDKIIGDKISSDNVLSMHAVTPNIGRNEVSRWLFDCVRKNTLYGLNVDITSNRTRQEYAMNKAARYPISYDTSVNPACDTCDDDTYCREISCGMVDMFNGTMGNNAGFFDYREEPKPVKAFVYNPTNYIFCLTGVVGDSGKCDSFTGIKGVRIQGKDTLFSGTLGSTTTTHSSQIQQLINEIWCSFSAHQGAAWVSDGDLNSACTDIEITINSCMGVQLIKYDDTYIDPCATEAVSFSRTIPKNCVNCGSAASQTKTYGCAIGFVGELAEEGCDCLGKSDYPVTYYPTNVAVSAIEGFVDGVFEIVVPAVSPEGFGVQLWEDAYGSEPRPGYNDSELRTGGQYDKLLDIARSKGVLLDCSTPYCVISWEANAYGHWADPIGLIGSTVVRNIIAIPQSFSQKEALVADLNALKNVNNCYGIVDIACTEDPEPGPPTPSVSTTPYATPSVTPSVTKSVSITHSVTKSISVTPSISISVTPSTSH